MMKGVLSYTVTAVDMAQNTRWNRRSFAAAHAMTELVSSVSFTSATTTSMAIADFWFLIELETLRRTGAWLR
jgi:hypothetical protein